MSYELAEQFLNQADELIEAKQQPEQLLHALDQAEKIAVDDASVLCRSARTLFRYGLLHGKGRFFLLAQDKLKRVEEKNPLFLDTRYVWWQLWGNILIQLGKMTQDIGFFEAALEKYQRAASIVERVCSTFDPELYWDWGDAWALLGQKSGEISDFQQALSKFHQVFSSKQAASKESESKGAISIFFRLDYGTALLNYGDLIGDLTCVEEAISLFRTAVADSYGPDQPISIVYHAAWRKLAQAYKVRFLLSHSLEHLEGADRMLREAILACPKNSELWLEWGDLYLQAGWLRRDLKGIETGLEKLTSPKVKECDPLRVSALLGMGLVMLGLFLENLKLIKDGKGRIEEALEADPSHRHLTFASHFAHLALALYFSDEATYAESAAFFEKGIHEDTRSVECWHALFQTYMAWGMQIEDPSILQKGVEAIGRLSALRPSSPIHLNEWGVALMRHRELETYKEQQIIYLEEAINKFAQASELSYGEETLYNWGCALDLLGDITGEEEEYLKAIELLTSALEKKPNYLHIRYRLAQAYSHIGELTGNPEYLTQAIEFLESVIKLDPDDENVWCDLGYAQLNLAELILSSVYPESGLRHRNEAEKALIRAAELGSADAYYQLACLYSLTGHYDASIRYLLKAERAGSVPAKPELQHDEWLEGVRQTPAFQEFLARQEEEHD